MKNKVNFRISDNFTYCRCRACNQRILWFYISVDQFSGEPEIHFLQAPDKGAKAHCPYCGKKELWAEDE